MTTQTFTSIYGLALQEDGSFQVQGGTSDFTYGISGGADGLLLHGQTFHWTFDPEVPGVPPDIYSGTFLGGAADGVVFSQPDGHGDFIYYLLSDAVLADGAPVEPSTDDYEVVCFLAGTLIATPCGRAAIETLRPGDLVLTHDGRAEPVRWLFVQTVSTRFADPLKVAPVRIRAGALGDSLPARDLLVSPDHALLLDGVLVHAGALVNGASITRETTLAERFAYYHLELEDHSLVLAEGVAAETFVDNLGRRVFDNWRDYEAVHGDSARICEIDLPRVKAARQLPAAVRARIEVSAAA